MAHPTEFKNDNISVSVENLPTCKALFKLKISPEYVKSLRSKATKNVNKEVSVPGFRKGKAPDDVIRKQYGKYVEQELKEVAVRTVVHEAMTLTKTYPLRQDIGLEVQKYMPQTDGSVDVTYMYETFPQVPDIQLEGIPLTPVAKQEATDEEVEKAVEEVRLYHAQWKEVEDRPIHEGDYVVIDIDVLPGDEKEPPFRAYENSRFHVVEKGMPPWARKLVLGKKVGEFAEGMSEKQEYDQGDFKPRKCRVSINLVQEAELPELNDELAKKAGAFSVSDLRTNIRKQITHQKAKERQEAIRSELKNYLIDTYQFELPATDITNLDQDCRQMVEKDRAQFKSKEDMAAYKSKLLESGKGVMRLAYLLPHATLQMGLSMPSENDINARLIEWMTHHYLNTRQKIDDSQITHLYQKMKRDLIQERALDALIEKNLK